MVVYRHMTEDNHSPDDAQPAEILQLYLDTRKEEVSDTTLSAHQYRLNHFVRWCDEVEGINDMRELTGRKLHEYRLWRREDGDLNTVSLHTQLSTLRVFLKFCENIDVVEQGLFNKVVVPSLRDGEEQRDTILKADRAQQILKWLETYEYASFDHVLVLLLWRTGMRIGAAHSLDLNDYDAEKERLSISHRPQGGTSLKLGKDGERIVSLTSQTCAVLNDYITRNRRAATDDQGRKPLLTTAKGRAARSTLRRHVYRCMQPCQRTGQCPHDVSMNDCEARGYAERPSDCPSIVSPHDIRRGAITHWLQNDVPAKVVGDRMNVTQDVMDKHYDRRSEEGKAEQRRKYLNQI